MRSIFFIFFFFTLSLAELWAINCTYEVKQSNTNFTSYELSSAILSVTSPLLNIQKIELPEKAKPSNPCHMQFLISEYSSVLSINLFYANKNFLGGSQQFNLEGLREALVRAFYKEEEFKKKTCDFFGEQYHLNCLLYQ